MDHTSVNEIQTSVRADALAGRLQQARRLADMAGVARPGAGGPAGDQDARGGDAEVAGAAFEKLFATLLVREMNKTLQDGFFGDGPGSDTFNGWLEEHFAGALAEDGSLGIAEAVRAALLQKQAAEDGEDGSDAPGADGARP